MVTFAIADLISHLWSTSTATVRVLVGWLFNVQTSFALLLFPRARERNPCFTTTDRRPQLRARRSTEGETCREHEDLNGRTAATAAATAEEEGEEEE